MPILSELVCQLEDAKRRLENDNDGSFDKKTKEDMIRKIEETIEELNKNGIRCLSKRR